MTDEGRAVIKLSANYIWLNPDLSRLVEATRGTLLGFIGPKGSFRGSIERLGTPRVQKDYKSIAAWASSLSANLELVSAHLYSSELDRTANIDVDLSRRRVSMWLSVPDYDEEAAKDIVKRLEREMLLQEEPDSRAWERPSGLEREYFVQKPEESDWFDRVISLFQSQTGRIDYFNGSFHTKSAPRDRHSRADLSAWKSDIIECWSQIVELSCSMDSQTMRMRFWCDFEREEIGLEIKAQTEKEIHDTFEVIERQLALKPISDTDVRDRLIGSVRKYFMRVPADREWFDQAVTTIRSHLRGKVHFSGRFRLASAPQQESTRRNLDSWKEDVLSNWNEIIATYCWLDSRNVKVKFQCDPQREIVDLEVEARTQDEVDVILQQLTKELNLELIQEEPYEFRRSSGEFNIVWSSQGFAEAVEDAVKLAFNRKYVVMEAFIEEWQKGKKVLRDIKDLSSFLQQVRGINVDSYIENVYLYIQGPRGIDLGIFVVDNLERLELKSSLRHREFSELVRAIKKPLKLKEVKKEEARERQEKKEKGRLDVVVKFLPVITLVLGFLLSPITLAAAFPKHQLQITYPSSEEGQQITASAQQGFRLEWALETEQWFRKTINRDSLATIRILEDSSPDVDVRKAQYPGAILHLNPGRYTVEVVSAQSGVFDRIVIEILP